MNAADYLKRAKTNVWRLRRRWDFNQFRLPCNVIAGPWLGEFGWELMRWQGIFRWLKKRNPRIEIVMVGRPGHDFLYQDYVDDYIAMAQSGQTDMHLLDDKEPLLAQELLDRYPDSLYLLPRTAMVLHRNQQFIRYGKLVSDGYDLLCHARNTTKANSAERNWPLENWSRLRERFPEIRMGSIGAPDASLVVPGTDDLRGITLSKLADTLRASRLLAGPSSGPMHLASLCGTPHLVWTDNKPYIDNLINRKRYEQVWNPLGTKALVLDAEGWAPRVETVANAVEQCLRKRAKWRVLC